MEEKQYQESLPAADMAPAVSLTPHENSKFRFFAVFLICCAVLTAAFAASALLVGGENREGSGFWSFFREESAETDATTPEASDTAQGESPKEEAPDLLGKISVVSKDLSRPDLGEFYIHNETLYKPNASELLSRELLGLQPSDQPQVLILHTHTSESYFTHAQDFLDGAPGDLTYSKDAEENMIAVGKVLCEVLNEKGITAIHCTVMHDSPTLAGSYERSAETVRNYLKQYPTISYVIDLHRDAVMTSDGEYVRTEASDPDTAQVMAVVGSDCNGTAHALWEENLALALQLRAALNQRLPALCRPVSLRNASYNQELAPRFLLLEIGSGANTVEEAKNAARLVGEVLADLLQAR